jgi:uncharacterized protein YqfA (UPF0365 family)
MKKYIWIVIAVVIFFLGLIIAYTLVPADLSVASKAATAAVKPL